jgi:hypothetical protein
MRPRSPQATESRTAHLEEAGLLLRSCDGRDDVAEALARRLGIPWGGSRTFTWLVGSVALRARWWRDAHGRWLLRIASGWPADRVRVARNGRKADQPPQALILAECYAVGVTQATDPRGGPELARWRNRMLVDLGFLEAAELELPRLPETVTADAARTWGVIEEILQIRRVEEPPGTPLPLVAPWLARWAGVDENLIRRGKRALEREKFIWRVGSAPSRFHSRAMVLWRVREEAPLPVTSPASPANLL